MEQSALYKRYIAEGAQAAGAGAGAGSGGGRAGPIDGVPVPPLCAASVVPPPPPPLLPPPGGALSCCEFSSAARPPTTCSAEDASPFSSAAEARAVASSTKVLTVHCRRSCTSSTSVHRRRCSSLKLFTAAKGVSQSVLAATRVQERRGDYYGGHGFYYE
jgi:hypothetical protein